VDTVTESATPVPPPLAGVRVVDLTWVWAGPYSVMQLAHLGADVVKIESSDRLDVTRVLGPWADDEPGPDRSGYFNQQNQGKQGILLNLKEEAGRNVLRAMIAGADIVIANLRPGALDRMGFSYDEVRRLNPAIVAVSMTGFGETGPERDRMAYGSLIDALSGVAAANGAVGGGPTDFPMSLPDPCAGIHTTIATLAALYRAQATGIGTQVAVSMLEASVSAFPWPILYRSITGLEPPVIGNRDDLQAPHDTYRCRGQYEWVAVAVETDEQFVALARAVGQPELAEHPRFATRTARQLHADELDGVMSAWTLEHEPEEAAALLRAAGVPAECVLHMNDLFESKPLLARRFFTELDHPAVGVRQLAGTAWSASRSPMTATLPAPCLGQHTRSVLARWLGMSDAEIDALDAAGILR
jgi:benzylsuccinate CoA-transferase BbsF subunit